MRLSIVVPIYNTEKYLKACLDSIISQKSEDIEILCVNDASTDGSLKILYEYSKIDRRIKILENDKNYGLSFSRNRGINESCGEYIWFVDGDDQIMDNNAIDSLYKYAHDNYLDILAFCSEYRYETDTLKRKYSSFSSGKTYPDKANIISGEEFFSRFINEDRFLSCVPFYIFRRQWILDNNINFAHINFEDNLFMPIALFNARRVSWMNKNYYIYFRRENSITTTEKTVTSKISDLTYVIEKLMAFWGAHSHVSKTYIMDAILKNLYSLTDIIIFEYLRSLKLGYDVQFDNLSQKLFFATLLEQRYPKISRNIDDELVDIINNGKKIIVYGAGFISKSVQCLLRDLEIKEYQVAVTVSDNKYLPELKEFMDYSQEYLVIIAADKSNTIEMDKYAKELGFINRLCFF